MAEYTPLASADDVEALLGRDLTSSEEAQVEALLVQASGLFRKAAGRDFTAGRFTNRLKVNGGEVRLPNSPVIVIHAVTDDAGSGLPYTAYDTTLTVPGLLSHQFVRVDYEAGGDIPELVALTVAGMVVRLLTVDPLAKSGFTQYQETTGPFSEGGTFAAWAVGGQMMLSPSDTAVAQSFRPPRLPNTVVHQ